MSDQMNPLNRTVWLAAGGTGGHVFPALHTADALKARGFDVSIITDKRGLSLLPKNVHRKTISAASPFAGSLPTRVLALAKLFIGFLQIFTLLLRQRPLAVIGYGGYSAASPALAAWLLRIPVWLHEQNAIMGRTNQLLSKFARGIFISWPKTTGLPAAAHHFHTGLPVAAAFSRLPSYADKKETKQLHLAVFGGSLGAFSFADILPQAVTRLPDSLKSVVRITQQARSEQIDALMSTYASQNIFANIRPFFTNVAGIMETADLVICRSGASAVAELAAAGRPSVLIPLAHALDDHQLANARQLADIDAAVIVQEKDLTADQLAAKIASLLSDPQKRLAQANAATTIACPDAAHKICNIIETHLIDCKKDAA